MKVSKNFKKARRTKRKVRINKKITGTAERPRLSIYKSNKHIQLQLIDDKSAKTLFGLSTLSVRKELDGKSTSQKAEILATQFATEYFKKEKNKHIVFDRSGFAYHGNIQKIADTLRSNGFEF